MTDEKPLPPLSELERKFVDGVVAHGNAVRAAREAGYRKPSTEGFKVRHRPDVSEHINARLQERAESLELQQENVTRFLWGIVNADANDVLALARTCCRYCHGENHEYQRTEREMRDARREHDTLVIVPWVEAGADKAKEPAGFDEQGGIGWDATRNPHPDCPECFGEGLPTLQIRDTRYMPRGTRNLLEGIKQNDDGTIEVKLASKLKAVELLARNLGMFKEKIEHSGAVTFEQRIADARKRMAGAKAVADEGGGLL